MLEGVRHVSKRGRVFLLTACAAAGTLVLSLSPAVKAEPVTFAQFSEINPEAPNEFAYFDNPAISAGTDSELVTYNGSTVVAQIPINFSYVGVPSLPANLQGNQQAILTLSSSTVAPVISLGANFYDQQIMANGALPDILTVTRNTPAGEGSGAQTNLLTMVFTGQLVGQLNSRTPQVSGDTTLGNTVVYSTDFSAYLPFLSSSLTNDFSLTFSSWTTLLNGLGLQVDGSDNYFDTAYAAGAATFDAQATVPEPGTLGIAALGLTGILLRRRSKAKTKK